MRIYALYILIISSFITCIGTDLVDDLILEPKIVINNLLESLKVGDSHQFTAKYFDSTGNESENTIEWISSNSTIVSITADGLVTAHEKGEVFIIAQTIDRATFTEVLLTVSEETGEVSNSRTGTFSGTSGYTAVGTATLQEEGGVFLNLSSDFKTSFALGTFIYLSNSTSGSSTKSSGLELGEINSNGAKTFNVTSKSSSITLDTYKYVIVLCKPAGITFGSAELN